MRKVYGNRGRELVRNRRIYEEVQKNSHYIRVSFWSNFFAFDRQFQSHFRAKLVKPT